jgi:hypothetical protein
MPEFKIMSLNGENMMDLIPKDPGAQPGDEQLWRSRLLAELVGDVDPDIIGLVEAPPGIERTRRFVNSFLDDRYDVYQGEKRGALGLAFLIRKTLGIQVQEKSKQESLKAFKLDRFDADRDGIKEIYSWANRVPYEIEISGGSIAAPVVFILIHSKSKGVFIPGDLFAYELLSRANRMKLRAQGWAVRNRLNKLITDVGVGRVIVMGDFNDGPEFDVHAAYLGGAFLEPVMGSVWDPHLIFSNHHRSIKDRDRWTIDFRDRVVNPVMESRYGQPTTMRSWIDHILFSPELTPDVIDESAGIAHRQPRPQGLPAKYRGLRGTDHHPPYVSVVL